jgi:CdiI N-terminal domain
MDDFEERFLVQLDYWTPEDYRRQWREGAQRIADGLRLSCLITQMPTQIMTNDQVIAWTLYRLDETDVAVRQEFLPGVDSGSPYSSLSDYERDDEISEWHIDVADLEKFAADSV